MRQIFIDIETTGLYYSEGDRIVEVAALEYINQVPTGKHIQIYFNPEKPMPLSAFEVHGLDDNFLKDKPVFKEGIEPFIDFIKGADEILLHNGKNFDIPFLNYELYQAGLQKINKLGIKKTIDTLKVARAVSPSKKKSLAELCQFYQIDDSERNFHGALIDCKLLASVYYKMMQNVKIEPDTSERMEPIKKIQCPPLRAISLNEQEVLAKNKFDEDLFGKKTKFTPI